MLTAISTASNPTLMAPGVLATRGFHSLLRRLYKKEEKKSGALTHYEVLKIKPKANADEIKKAYVRAIRDADTRGDDALYARAATAYHVLSDRTLRKAYDKNGCKETLLPSQSQEQDGAGDNDGDEEAPRSRAETVLASILNENGVVGMLGVGPMAKFLGDMIGVKQPTPQEALWESSSIKYKKGTAPRNVVLSLTLDEAIRGGWKNVEVPYNYPCGACGGHGKVPLSSSPSCSVCRGKGSVSGASCKRCKGMGVLPIPKCTECNGVGVKSIKKSVKVKVPFGAIDGEIIQTSVSHGKTTVPVFVQISVKKHPIFRRDNNDVHVEVPLTIAQASLGGRAKLPMIDGSLKTIKVFKITYYY